MTKRTRQETETHEPEPDINLQPFGLSASDILDAVSADLPEEQLDETPEPTSFGPQPWEYAPAAKATGALEKLNDLFVLDELACTVMIPSLSNHRRILLVFLRQFGWQQVTARSSKGCSPR